METSDQPSDSGSRVKLTNIGKGRLMILLYMYYGKGVVEEVTKKLMLL